MKLRNERFNKYFTFPRNVSRFDLSLPLVAIAPKGSETQKEKLLRSVDEVCSLLEGFYKGVFKR